MILPFVRELFADAEKTPAFQRALSLLKPPPGERGAGRIRVSGLTPSAKALHLPLLRRTLGRPLLVIVKDNRAGEEFLPVLRAFAELSGAVSPGAVVLLPAHDVLPFENLSPHPEIQEERASSLWKIASGAAEIVIAPAEAAAGR